MTGTLRLDDEAAVTTHLHVLAEEGELPPDSLLILLADAEARPISAVGVDDIPPDPPQDERVRTLGPFLRQLRQGTEVEGVLLVVARAGTSELSGGDLAWHDAFVGTARTARLSCHGVYVVTSSGVTLVRSGASEAA